ncbi:MAG: biosynthetic-type acetolactate synthase large subunit [Spirochaetes bacterium]|nr:biosynthetic-type acetolactate synthase large subunit [Spirochaetota bacterium]
MKRTGSEILINGLIEEGTDTIFGIPGGSVIAIFDTLFDYSAKIKFYLMRHEQAAAHAADGYSRSTGRVGVCMATSGPGATNLVTGIATAYMDSIPMVAITGQVATKMIGNDAFQEVNTTGITYAVTKHNYLVKDVRDLPRVIKEAFYLAKTGRPGPVLIDIPSDISKAQTEFKKLPEKVNIRGYNPTYEGNIKQIQQAAKMIMEAKKPVIYAGGGVILSGADKELKSLVEKTGIPVTMTLLGLGGFPSLHPLSLEMLGMHGTKYANIAVSDSDLVISIGARFDDRVTGKLDEFAPHAKIIHIDIDPSSIGKSVDVDMPIVGDVKLVLKELLKYVSKCDIKEWVAYVKDIKKKYPLSYTKSEKVIKPQYVLEQLYDLTKGEAIICTEVGQHQMWAAQYYKYARTRQLLSSGGLGTMGYGFPAAIGAAVANPQATVVDIAGDGSIQMNIQELATVSNYQIPVKVVIMNNMYLGMVRQWQQLFFKKRYSFTCLGRHKDCSPICHGPGSHCPDMVPDFEQLAKAYNVKGYTIKNPKDVRGVLKEALAIKGPVIMDFRVDQEENVFPMVPAGQPINKMLEHSVT